MADSEKRRFAGVDVLSKEDDNEWIGPMPEEAAKAKKRRILEFERVYLENLPSGESYERSYMHRDVITHIVVTKTDFIITASCDGHVKFWRKLEEEGIEFVKHFRSHLGNIQDLAANFSGTLCCTVSDDKSAKIFHVVDFDMINMLKLSYVPQSCGWLHKSGDTISALAITDRDSSAIWIYDGMSGGQPIHVLEKLHFKPVTLVKYNPVFEIAVSVDKAGMVEYWSGPKHDYAFPKNAKWQYKTDTDLFDFVKCQTVPTGLCFSPDGKLMATMAMDRKVSCQLQKTGTVTDFHRFSETVVSFWMVLLSPVMQMNSNQRMGRNVWLLTFSRTIFTSAPINSTVKWPAQGQVRIFRFLTGKLKKVLDESLQQFSTLQQTHQLLPNMEFGRRMAVERDLEKSGLLHHGNIEFDESGYFVLYTCLLGVKVVNLHTNQCVRTLGKPENARLLHIALFQGSGKEKVASMDVEMVASDNPSLQNIVMDPCLFCTAFKKNRFYIFSRREPEDLKSGDTERDIFNEKPSKEELVAATQDASYTRVAETCIIHTTLGDIQCKLFPRECPKTVENFCVHSRNSYYNGHVFHRIIKGFMVQTGDPLGNGTGGESIWGGEFEDEFHSSLRHDRPYTISMANAGPSTNGSQFFITVVPTPWLDNKHTVFGRVTKGMEVVQSISSVKCNPKTDKPYEEIRIISITIK